MKREKALFILPASSAIAVSLFTGCISVPMGKETFTTEYQTEIRATWNSPTKTYEPAPTIADADDGHRSVSIGLLGRITSTQPQERHYEKITLEKRKRLAFGLFPSSAEVVFRPKKALVPQSRQLYKGNGQYGTYSDYAGHNSMGFGSCLGFWCLFGTVESLLVEPFAPFERDVHYFGRFLKSESQVYGRVIKVNNTFASEDIDWLLKFSPSDRRKIGAWTFHENATHPHNTFWNGLRGTGIIGFDKHCYYIFRDPEKLSKTDPVAPKVTTSQRTVQGPYTASLRLPSIGFSQTVAVEPGTGMAKFDLVDAANGDTFAEGFVCYSLPPEGTNAVRNADDRAILQLAVEREWPVTIALPMPAVDASAQRNDGALYRIVDISRTDDDTGFVVRVAVEDTSKTLSVLSLVKPEIQRLVREDFQSRNPDIPAQSIRERLQYEMEDGGKCIVFKGWAFLD